MFSFPFSRFKVPFQLLQCYGRMAHGLKFHAGITSQDTQQNVLATGVLQRIPLKVKLELGKQWEYADFIGEKKVESEMKIHLQYLDVFRTYLWSILNSNYVMITLWRLTRKPSQTIVFQCFFPGRVVPVRSKWAGRVSWLLYLEASKIDCQPAIVRKHLSRFDSVGNFYSIFCWVEVSLVCYTTAEFAVPLWIRCFFDSSKNPWWIDISEIVEHLKAVRPFD